MRFFIAPLLLFLALAVTFTIACPDDDSTNPSKRDNSLFSRKFKASWKRCPDHETRHQSRNLNEFTKSIDLFWKRAHDSKIGKYVFPPRREINENQKIPSSLVSRDENFRNYHKMLKRIVFVRRKIGRVARRQKRPIEEPGHDEPPEKRQMRPIEEPRLDPPHHEPTPDDWP